MQTVIPLVTEMITANVPVNARCKVAVNENNDIYISSKWIAEYMHYEHKAVMRSIKKILDGAQYKGQYDEEIQLSQYEDEYRRYQPCYVMNIAGFFTYCANSKMTPGQIREWSQVISELVKRVKSNYNRDIAALTYQLSTQTLDLDNLQGEELLSRAMLYAKDVIERSAQRIQVQQAQIQRQAKALQQAQPAIQFAKAVEDTNDLISVSELASIIGQALLRNFNAKGPNLQELYAWLRANNYVSKQKGSTWNKPRIAAIRDGLLEVKESPYKSPNSGEDRISRVTRVTPKGQSYFLSEFLRIYENGGTFKDGIQGHEVRTDVHDYDGPAECMGENPAPEGA